MPCGITGYGTEALRRDDVRHTRAAAAAAGRKLMMLAGKARRTRGDVPRWATNVNLYASVHAMRCEIVIQLMVLLHDSCRVESSRFNSNIAILNPSTHFTTIHRPFAKIITAPELNSVPDKV